jgi:hypothetical protein
MVILEASAQLPVKQGSKYHYLCDSSNVIFTVYADSLDIINEDTLVHLNRFIFRCDTISDFAEYQNEGAIDVYLRNQPLFLQRQYLKSENKIWFSSPASFVILTDAEINSPWLFDTVGGITATITSRTNQQVFSQIDEVSLILLSNGDSIQLSNKFGFLKFTAGDGNYFRLCGYEDELSSEGLIPGNYSKFFDYSIGDHLAYWETDQHPECDPYPTRHYHYNFDLRTEYENYTEYAISGYYCVVTDQCYGSTPYSETIFVGENYTDKYFGYSYQLRETDFGYSSQIKYFTDNKEIIESIPFTFVLPQNSSLHDDILLLKGECENSFCGCFSIQDAQCNFFRLEEGIGLIYDKTCFFENFYGKELLQFVDDGETVYNLLTELPAKENNMPLIISPNPVEETFTITGVNNEVTIKLYSNTGSIVKSWQSVSSGDILNIADLESGFYYVRISAHNAQMLKLLKL